VTNQNGVWGKDDQILPWKETELSGNPEGTIIPGMEDTSRDQNKETSQF
jgi:hypothetical protein